MRTPIDKTSEAEAVSQGFIVCSRLDVNSPFPCLSLPNIGIIDVYHCARIKLTFDS